MNIGFGLIVVVAVLLLVGAGAASWIGDHLAPVARVNGVTITKDQLRARVAIETFKLDDAESRTREAVQANHISASQGQQVIQYITQQRQQITTAALEDEIDTELILQLAAKRGDTATDADITAQITTDATTDESRHAFQIAIAPILSTGETVAKITTEVAATIPSRFHAHHAASATAAAPGTTLQIRYDASKRPTAPVVIQLRRL